MSTDSPLVQLDGIERRFEDGRGTTITALRAVSLQIYSGEYVCISGPSGSGKSTLLNILGCLDRPDAGRYRLAGVDVHKLTSDGLARLRRTIFGFVFQDYALLASATAIENVEVPASYTRLSFAMRRSRATQLLSSLGLNHRARHRPTTLSGGEQQRVSIARALMNGGWVILADEPTGALDRKNSEEVLRLFRHLSDQGHTVIIVSHDPHIAAHAGRRIQLLNGRVTSDSGSRSMVGRGRPPQDHSPTEHRAMSLAARIMLGVRAGLSVLCSNLMGTGRARAALTVFSMALGVAALSITLSIAEGVFYDTLDQTGLLGVDQIQITSSRRQGAKAARLTLDDAKSIATEISNVRRVELKLNQVLPIHFGGNRIDAMVEGYTVISSRAEVDGESLNVRRGRFISREDDELLNQVAVVGWHIADELFSHGTDPIGQYMVIDTIPFSIVGIQSAHDASVRGPDWGIHGQGRKIIIPLRTAETLIHGENHRTSLDAFVYEPLKLEATHQALKDLLIRRHGVDSFRFAFSEAGLDQLGEIRMLLLLGLGTIGCITLLAGGVGIMATMLLSVAQRRREIGIRMAMGARRRDITLQFVTEAAGLAMVGGVVGVLTSFAIIPLLLWFDIPVSLSLWTVVLALICALGTGFVAGVVPARRASRLDPVTALSTRT